MNSRKLLNKIRERRKNRTRANIYGTAEKPRLSVFRSNCYTYAQLIDDKIGKTLISALIKKTKGSSEKLGELIAKKAVEKGIKKAIFDRGNYKYHGRIKSIAEEAKKGGLQL